MSEKDQCLNNSEGRTDRNASPGAPWETRILSVDEGAAEAADLIMQGELVAFPTETVYGLGALGTNPAAVRKIYAAKGRPSDNPLILHFATVEAMFPYIKARTALFDVLAAALMPGPLTLIVEASERVPSVVTAGLPTVGLRCPQSEAARTFLAAVPDGLPVAAPSANLSGRPSPTTAQDVYEDLAGRVPLILDGGPSQVGLESSIIDLTDPAGIRILRPGAVHEELLHSILEAAGLDVPILSPSSVPLDAATPAKAPGMKYRHYAPRAQVTILEGDDVASRLRSFRAWCEAREEEERRDALDGSELPVRALYASETFREELAEAKDPVIQAMLQRLHLLDVPPSPGNPELGLARGLFAALREGDRLHAAEIAVESMDPHPIRPAYMNRLRKAASPRSALAPEDALTP